MAKNNKTKQNKAIKTNQGEDGSGDGSGGGSGEETGPEVGGDAGEETGPGVGGGAREETGPGVGVMTLQMPVSMSARPMRDMHIEAQLAPEEADVLRRTRDALHGRCDRMASGNIVCSHNDALRWLLQQGAEKLKPVEAAGKAAVA